MHGNPSMWPSMHAISIILSNEIHVFVSSNPKHNFLLIISFHEKVWLDWIETAMLTAISCFTIICQIISIETLGLYLPIRSSWEIIHRKCQEVGKMWLNRNEFPRRFQFFLSKSNELSFCIVLMWTISGRTASNTIQTHDVW